MFGNCVKVPQQNNFTDCGLFVLQYVEQFFSSPIQDFRLPVKNLQSWFDEIQVTRKREVIANLLKELIKKYNPDSDITLPDIELPTKDGKLIEDNMEDYFPDYDPDEDDLNAAKEKSLRASQNGATENNVAVTEEGVAGSSQSTTIAQGEIQGNTKIVMKKRSLEKVSSTEDVIAKNPKLSED